MKAEAMIENNFKETEIGLIPKDWEFVNINKFVRFEKGTEPGSANYNKEKKGIRFLRVVDVSSGKNNHIYTTSDNIKICEGKDILITFDGSPGVVRRELTGAYSSGIRKVLVTDNNLVLDYIYYVLQTSFVQETIKKYTTGVTIKHSSKAIPYIKIPLPLPAEQHKIAFVLSKTQQAIEQQVKIIQTTKELKKSLMNKLFTEGLHNEKQKETEIGLMPKSWKILSISEVLSEKLKNGAFIHHPKYGNGYLFINVEDIYKNPIIRINDLPRIDCKFSEVKEYLVTENDVLFVRSSLKREGIAYCCLVKTIKEHVFFDCHLIRARLDIKKIIPEYFVYYWLSSKGRQELIAKSKTTTMTTVNQNSLDTILFPHPDLLEQEEIANVFSNIDKKITQAETRKQTLQALSKTMLNQLITGRIRVKNLDIEVN